VSLPAIRAVLEGRLNAWVSTRTPALKVAWQNRAFTPPAGIYLRSYILTGETSSMDLAGKHRSYVGAHQISIVCPTGGGPGVSDGIAKEIEDLFPVALQLPGAGLTVVVVSPVSVSSPVTDEAEYLVPVSFSYRADVALI
jgi:hypothetical protein